MSVRLPEPLERRLAEEGRRSHKRRSEMVREAVADYVTRRERERYMAEIQAAAHVLVEDEASRQEALEIAEAAVDDGLDSIIEVERAAGMDPAEKWWR